MLIIFFIAYSSFCFWVVFLNGADVIEGWKSFFIFDFFASLLSSQELKFYVGLSWLASLLILTFNLIAGT
jgi:hypothetical protein